MLILIISLLLGWYLAGLALDFTKFIITKIFGYSINYFFIILLNFIVGICLILFINFILLDFSLNLISFTYCTEDENNPYTINVGSKYFNTNFSFDIRNIRDLVGIGVIEIGRAHV